jgi:hypothetical protein
MTEAETPPDRYAPPAGLADVVAAATCKTDVTITILEPKVSGTTTSSPAGTSWTGVEGVLVVISGGGRTFSGTTTASGVVNFAAVPCGSYRVELTQREFKITSRGPSLLNINSGKSGSAFEIKIIRQLLTVEMFRLPTLYLDSIRGGMGKRVDVDQDPYGHHWVKIYANESAATRERPMESYGWWPIEGASADRLWGGVKGSLNGYPVHSANPTQDPYHTAYLRANEKLEDVFFPYVTNGKTAAQYKDDIRTKAAAYAGISGNIWSWRSDAGGFHCKTFQNYLMREVRLWKRVGVGVGSFGWSANT